MSTPTLPPIEYPESDGQPIADNTLQFEWIVTIKGNLDILFRDEPNVFVAGDLLWYPVERNNVLRQAPDAMVAFGRPKGHRGSYRQWDEGGIAPQVVFEILSPGNRAGKMRRKRQFYERFGVEEYYVYDPDNHRLTGWGRAGEGLAAIADMAGWVSPRLGIRFEPGPDQLQIYYPDGRPFLTFVELEQLREEAERRAAAEAKHAATAKRRAATAKRRADAEAQRADNEAQRADNEAQRADNEAQRADNEAQRAAGAEREALTARQKAESLAAQLRALGIEPRE